jgi:hypothetical protein
MHMKSQNKYRKFKIKLLQNSVKFYLPRVEQYLEVVQSMASKYEDMSMIEIDGYFEGKFEPVKYVRVEIHTDEDIKDQMILSYANKIRQKLKQKSLALEFNNSLILVTED